MQFIKELNCIIFDKLSIGESMKTILLVIFIVICLDAGNHKGDNIFNKYPVNSCSCDSSSICFKPIGYFKTPYTKSTGAPRHGQLKPDVSATIELLKEYEGTCDMLEHFDFIIVLYYFDQITNWSPQSDNLGKHTFGVFATRSPGRPNPIGFCISKIDSIVGTTLYIRGVDAFDNTPVLDIKPYISSVDVINSRKNREAEYLFKHPYPKRSIRKKRKK